jgi:hypothetical protein
VFKKCVLAMATITAALAASVSAHAFTLLQGWEGGPVWGALWDSSLNTPATTPLTWTAGDADDGVWYRMYFNGRIDDSGAALDGLAASVTYRLTSVSADGKDWTFDYAVLNASNGSVTASNIRSFSFDVSPTDVAPNAVKGKKSNPTPPPAGPYLVDAHLIGPIGVFEYADLARNVAMNAGSSVGEQDICIKSGNTNTCHGGGNIGPKNGQVYGGSFMLSFSGQPNYVSFTDPMVRFNAIQINGRGDYSGTGIPYAWVPEPATWALMFLGVAGVGMSLRAQRRRLELRRV